MKSTLYFKNVEIVHFTVGGKVSQMDNQTLRFSDVQVTTSKRFERYDFAKADDTCVYLFNKVKRHDGTEKIALVAAYKIDSTNYMIDGKIIDNRMNIPFAINNKQSINEQLNFKRNAKAA